MKMSSKFTCRFCKEQFDVPKGLYKHLQQAHNAGASRDNRTCPICGVLCSKYEGYRDHLLYIHGQTDDGQKLTFKSLNEFLFWKTEIEIKHNCKYVLQSAPKVLPTKEKKYFYQCDSSNSKTSSKDRRDKKSMSVVMKTCSSVISVVEGTGIFKVEYWDTHSGHSSNTSSVQLTQNELEAAISSVEMVNAITGDIIDKSTAFDMPENANTSISIVEKPRIISKGNSPSSANNFNSQISNIIQKPKVTQLQGKFDIAKKKSTNTSILYSLASVACGKGIVKKPSNKLKDNKKNEVQNKEKTGLQVNSNDINETPNENSEIQPPKGPVKSVSAPASTASVPAVTSASVVSTAPSIAPSVATTTKTTSSGPLAIAPKITTVPSNTINSLFTTNSAFPNQLLIVNPVNLDQNSINSGQNVLATGQNILFSLGPMGPNNTTPQTINQISVLADKSSVSTGNVALKKTDTAVTTASVSLTSTQSVSNNVTGTITSTAVSSPITLSTGMNSAPVILSSLPVGSTFMSVNNNLIPIASPSGAFIPTSLPPNIVLTPVVPGTTVAKDSSSKPAVSSATLTPQSQIRFTTPSTVAITVSSIVKEPVFTSSTVKHMNSIASSNSSPVSSASAQRNSKKAQNKFVPITVAGTVSPVAKSVSSKAGSNKNSSVNKANSSTDKSESSKTVSNKTLNNSNVSNTKFDANSLSPIKSPSARKRMPKRPAKAKQSTSSTTPTTPKFPSAISSTPISTKVVNSHLTLSPISSTPNVTMTNKPGSFLFESSGEIYMLEPVDNDAADNFTTVKSPVDRMKLHKSVQTSDISSVTDARPLQRKRASSVTDDSAVMLKVKCYQLEMKYLETQTQCKRLKVELTKERLKNAELTGENADSSLIEEQTPRKQASEVMKDIEDEFSGNRKTHIYTMMKTSVLHSLYEDLEDLCIKNRDLHKELENYRTHDKFYQNLKKRLYDEDF